MNPSPDEHHEIEPPKTRALNSTDVDESAQPKGVDADGTLDDDTKRMARSASLSDFGMGLSLGSLPVSTGGTPIRGVSGKIEPNQTLYSKYLVIRKLGGGAMGDVWLVRHLSMDDLHALKLIVSNIASNEVALKRFQREFKVMASLKHPHAVQIYDACIDDDGGYIDMEYVQGQTIHDLLTAARKRPDLDPTLPLMPLDWIVKVLDQLTDVLQEAHEKWIVHRDLKPGNLMLVDGRKPGKENLKVLDFGIAKIRDDPDNAANMTLTQGFIGTPSYGSPEQAMNRQDIDGRADIYSVGVMLYEFVTGRLPFKGVHFQVMHQHATMPPPPFHEINPKLGSLPELEHAILRALSKDREHRQQTARELFEEVARAVEDILGPSRGTPAPSTWNNLKNPVQSGTAIAEHGTEHDGGSILFPGGPDTLSITANEPGEAKPEDEPSSSFAGVVRPPTWRRRLAIGLVALGLILVVAGLAYQYGNLGGWAGKSYMKPSKPFLPDGYEAVDGIRYVHLYPEKVIRKADQVEFTYWADGIYLPAGYSPVDGNDLVDGWPRYITRDGVDKPPRFVRIKGNEGWIMGAWDADPTAAQNDAPAHSVFLSSGFYMQETEVTNGELEYYFQQVLRPEPSEWRSAFADKKKEDEEVARKHPAVSISRKLAVDYARYVFAMLPTEAQWEYAARSRGKKSRYVSGIKRTPDRTVTNIQSLNQTTAPVGSYPKDVTEQGLFDMTGNVKEMCRDVWKPYEKREFVVKDPIEEMTDAANPDYVVRGGDYISPPEDCTTTYRDDKRPEAKDGYPGIGFRLVIECPDARPVPKNP
jgi:eukaryotic-like serine/threonine-protein kinase